MTGLSSQGEATVLTALIGTSGSPTTYVSLHTADPTDTGLNEVSGNGYARMGPVAFSDSGNNPTIAANSAIVTYPIATGSWGTIVYFGLWAAATGGLFYGSGIVNPGKAINNGDQARFLAGALTVTAQ